MKHELRDAPKKCPTCGSSKVKVVGNRMTCASCGLLNISERDKQIVLDSDAQPFMTGYQRRR